VVNTKDKDTSIYKPTKGSVNPGYNRSQIHMGMDGEVAAYRPSSKYTQVSLTNTV
jgi:hypothetical protein